MPKRGVPASSVQRAAQARLCSVGLTEEMPQADFHKVESVMSSNQKMAIPDLDGLPLSHVLVTRDAAAALGRSPQTLRKWACYENGPLRPVRINGRLGWKVADLLRVRCGGQA